MFIVYDQDSPDADLHLIDRRVQIAFHQDNYFDGKRAYRHRMVHHAALSQKMSNLPLPFLDSREGQVRTERTPFRRKDGR